MAITLVQAAVNASGTSGGPYTTSYGSAVTVGSLGIAGISLVDDTNAPLSFIDDQSQTWTLLVSGAANGLVERPHIYAKANSLSGVIDTTLSLSATANAIRTLLEFAGAETSLAGAVVSPSATGSGSTPSVTLTSVPANSVIVAYAVSSNVLAAPSGYSVGRSTQTNWFEEFSYILDSGTAGSKTINFGGSNGTWTVAAAAIPIAGGGGGGGGIANRAGVLARLRINS